MAAELPGFRAADRRARGEDRRAAARPFGRRGSTSARRSRGCRRQEPAAHDEHLREPDALAGRAARAAPAAPVHARLRQHRSSRDFTELHGDRMYGDDPAIVGGLARLDGRAGHADRPAEGPRHQGARAPQLRHAEAGGLSQGAAADAHWPSASRLPIITLIDTPGAYPGVGAEERSQSEAIARNLFEMSDAARADHQRR